MKKIIILFLFAIHFFHPSNCQSDNSFTYKAKNSVYTEFFGHGFVYSINYDRLLGFKKKLGYGFKVGFGGNYPFNEALRLFENKFSSIPLGGYLLFGKRKHYVEWDISIIPSFGGDQGTAVDFGTGIAYRLQPPKGGQFFTVGLIHQTANIIYDDEDYNFTFAKIGFGYTFDKKIDSTFLPLEKDKPKRNFAHFQVVIGGDRIAEKIGLFERLLLKKGLFSLTAAAGIGVGDADCRTTYIPLELTVLFGKVYYLEFSGTSPFVLNENEYCSFDWTFIKGYRYGIRFQNPKGRLVVRIGAIYLPSFHIENLRGNLTCSIGMAF